MHKTLAELILSRLKDSQPFTMLSSGTCYILGAPKEDPGAIRQALEQLVQLGEIKEYIFEEGHEPSVILVNRAA